MYYIINIYFLQDFLDGRMASEKWDRSISCEIVWTVQ